MIVVVCFSGSFSILFAFNRIFYQLKFGNPAKIVSLRLIWLFLELGRNHERMNKIIAFEFSALNLEYCLWCHAAVLRAHKRSYQKCSFGKVLKRFPWFLTLLSWSVRARSIGNWMNRSYISWSLSNFNTNLRKY